MPHTQIKETHTKSQKENDRDRKKQEGKNERKKESCAKKVQYDTVYCRGGMGVGGEESRQQQGAAGRGQEQWMHELCEFKVFEGGCYRCIIVKSKRKANYKHKQSKYQYCQLHKCKNRQITLSMRSFKLIYAFISSRSFSAFGIL